LVYVGKYDLEENNTIGMYCFLRNVSFFAVNLDFANETIDIKEEVKQLVDEGLKDHVVTPIWRIVYNHQKVGEILK